MRGFEVCRGFDNCNILLPERKTKNSAGYDICLAEDLVIKPNSVVLAKTGLKAFMQEDEVLYLYLRSSIGLKKHLLIPNSVGIIDSDYYSNETNDGHIFVSLYNFGHEEIFLQKGERIAQGIFSKFLKATNEVSNETKRIGGFGSTDNS